MYLWVKETSTSSESQGVFSWKHRSKSSLQNVLGYSTTFARDYDEVLRQVALPPLIEKDKYPVIDYKRMREDQDYRTKILNDESLAAEEMVIKIKAVLDALRQDT